MDTGSRVGVVGFVLPAYSLEPCRVFCLFPFSVRLPNLQWLPTGIKRTLSLLAILVELINDGSFTSALSTITGNILLDGNKMDDSP